MLFKPIKFLAGILCAIVLSQFPEFSQQYQQRLGGKLGELQRVVTDFTNDANLSDQSVQDAIDRLKASGDELVAARGDRLEGYVNDFSKLLEHQDIFLTGNFLEIAAVIILNLDSDLVIATYEQFSPAIPVSIDGFLLAGVGFVVGYLSVGILLFFLKLGLKAIFRRRKVA